MQPHPILLPHKTPSTLFSQELLDLQLSKHATVVNSLPARCLHRYTGRGSDSESEEQEERGEKNTLVRSTVCPDEL